MTNAKEEDDVGVHFLASKYSEKVNSKRRGLEKKDTKTIHSSEALLWPLGSLNMGDMATATGRGRFFGGVFCYFFFFCNVSAG